MVQVSRNTGAMQVEHSDDFSSARVGPFTGISRPYFSGHTTTDGNLGGRSPTSIHPGMHVDNKSISVLSLQTIGDRYNPEDVNFSTLFTLEFKEVYSEVNLTIRVEVGGGGVSEATITALDANGTKLEDHSVPNDNTQSYNLVMGGSGGGPIKSLLFRSKTVRRIGSYQWHNMYLEYVRMTR